MQKGREWLRLLLHFLLLVAASVSEASRSPPENLLQSSEALALLAFKSAADLGKKLQFSPDGTGDAHCQWQGVKCVEGKVVRVIIEGVTLGGVFGADTLSRLDQLRVLSLQNNSLGGPIPDLARLVNLKALFLDHNSFTGYFPPSVLFLHRLRTLDLSYNNLTGPIPIRLASLDRLYYLRLDWNQFNGSIPPFNQSSLQSFDVSGNNFTGAIPVTPTLSHFGAAAFLSNPGLCGEILHKECHPREPFFSSSPAVTAPQPPRAEQSEQVRGVEFAEQSPKHKKTVVILGFSSGVFVLFSSIACFAFAVKKQRSQRASTAAMASDSSAAGDAAAVMQIEEENELEEKVKKVQGMQVAAKSGSLVFCAGEAQVYSLEQLMRASAELLGRGTIGTTYKAVLDNRLIVSVKRLDAGKTSATGKEAFERHMESVGGLRHPNLVPLRAYFQAKEERLLIYDYQPNGSLFSLIHGSKSTRAKPLHWTSCLKIAEDVAQGLSYIHQAWRLVHGNLKSSNVLLGPDFEACLSDYCLAVLAATSATDTGDPAASAHQAPEIRKPHRPATPKSDVYSFGVLLMELLTGKPASEHPDPVPGDMPKWVRTAREDDGGEDQDKMGMLLEVAVACSATSPEQRPTMWQVLRMIQEIKEAVLMEDTELMDPTEGVS
ncbi:probable inactive receptor kinase At5g67200 [Malania oleifera]|uniref:probable inactive receptor kinase At5g67200 n=1 Tax=Malania oleifera TaxID=397392 RepID=UPI0025ADBCC1|nr:probable inactive receptor kinase At5g67200 [Malania oleifera]